MKEQKPERKVVSIEEDRDLVESRNLLLEAREVLDAGQRIDGLIAEMSRRIKKYADRRSKLTKEQSSKERESKRAREVSEEEIQQLAAELEQLVAEQKDIQERTAPPTGWLKKLFGGKNQEFEDRQAADFDAAERRIKAKKDELGWARSAQAEALRLKQKVAQINQESSELDELDAAAERAKQDALRQKQELVQASDALREKMVQALLLKGFGDAEAPKAQEARKGFRHEPLETLSRRLKDEYHLDDNLEQKSPQDIEIQKISDQMLQDLEKAVDEKFHDAGSAALLVDEMREKLDALSKRSGKGLGPVSLEHKEEGRQDFYGQMRSTGGIFLAGLRVAQYTEIDDSGLIVDWKPENFREAVKKFWGG